MNAKNILGIVTAFFVFVTAVSGHTTTSHKKSVHFRAPTGAYQKVNGTDAYRTAAEPPATTSLQNLRRNRRVKALAQWISAFTRQV
jgi:hypothetical protein